jgi:hypothetical protein
MLMKTAEVYDVCRPAQQASPHQRWGTYPTRRHAALRCLDDAHKIVSGGLD